VLRHGRDCHPCPDSCVAYQLTYLVNSDTVAPTRLTFCHADVAGPEARVPPPRLGVSGQRECEVGP
jgi:hypothetical protein